MKKQLFWLFFLLCGCTSSKVQDELVCLQIIDRNDLTKTISNEERLKNFAKTDFLSSQPYKQVVQVYQQKQNNQKLSKITSYYPSGGLWQYLEVKDSRAYGSYRQFHPNGAPALKATVIGGPASLSLEDQKKWLFDGESLAFNEEGKTIGRFFYEKGFLEKTGFYYYPSGQVQKQIPYLHGEIQGELLEYFEQGELKSKTSFVGNQKQGPASGFFASGKIHYQEKYENGRLLEGVYFNADQELCSFIQNGKGWKSLFENGLLSSQMEYLEGQSCGQVKIFDSKGAIVSHYRQKNQKKEGEEIEFYPNGKPKISLTWHEDQIQGTLKTWYENGALASLSEWLENEKNGLSSAWYQDGSVMLLEEYENGKLKKGQYYRKGEKSPLSGVHDGSGLATLFDGEGNFLKKITYVQGKPEDPSR
ncbi:MAG: hypothetical protein WC371_05255 [Parachlamydiales bacterium]|jgi:antitoxin component YwqK of YwqJK toxin-antitoxin module